MAKPKSETKREDTGDQKPPEKENSGTQKPPEEKKSKTPTIGTLGEKLDPAVFAGVCAKMKWRPGKRVPEKEFKTAVKAFLDAPINGQPVRKEEKKEASK